MKASSKANLLQWQYSLSFIFYQGQQLGAIIKKESCKLASSGDEKADCVTHFRTTFANLMLNAADLWLGHLHATRKERIS